MSDKQTPNLALIKANEQLKQKLLRFATSSGKFATAIDGLMVTRFNQPHDDDSCFYAPSIGLLVQGDKQSLIGETTLHYGAYQCLVNGVDVPSVSKVFNVSSDVPFLAISLLIDRELATELSTELAATVPIAANDDYLGVSVAQANVDLVDAFSRLMDVLDTPDYIPILAPILIQEIHYHILSGPQADALRKIATKGSHSNQIAEAITWLKENYAKAIAIDTLAHKVKMASTSFHRHFKQVTSMSPLQFQKSLRLYEAQRLMLTEGKDANTASFTVGYESPTQFNRDYKKMFGEPPLRNIQKLRLTQH